MFRNPIPLWGGLCLLFSAGAASAQAPINTFAASTNHSASIRPDGSLWLSGINFEGQLGNGTTLSSPAPVQVRPPAPGTGWSQVAMGTSHTLALTTDGRIQAWGGNRDGQLGDGTASAHTTPVAVALPEAAAQAQWKQIAAGTSHSLALTTDGQLYAWGNNDEGQLGNGSSLDSPTPVAVSLPTSAANTTWAQIAAGNDHTLALTTDGRLFAWGNNQYGQLGDGSNHDALYPVAVGMTKKLSRLRWSYVAAGRFHTLAITDDGRIYTWGSNRFGQLGEEHDTQHNLPEPLAIPGHLAIERWAQVAAGDAHSVALSTDGHMIAWGNNCVGQLGDGTTDWQLSPVAIAAPRSAAPARWVRVVSGGFHTLAATADGELYAWGANNFGQLGDGTTAERHQPTAPSPVFALQTTARQNSSSSAGSSKPVEPWGLNDNRLIDEMPEAPSFMMLPQPEEMRP
ncbi:cell wall anchor protein [Hymenobacter sp. BT683]|uniref:Cell wall anchor protein n=1 Tax=Hymenobacter jeongseonensis TaxID=2791027 RepID=A0ABS0ICJ3_9BACT|nr:cell wall anchor protein [Hymenobacter jeongseonensis]MBF9236073.1 cell wall anchor protein [Hymenobacter jeongseonensis]